MNFAKTLIVGAAFAASAAGANAATYTADTVISATPGICTGTIVGCASNDRKNTNNAVDGNENTFYALGFGGSIVLGFSTLMSTLASNVAVFEVTFNREGSHNEAADVFALDGMGGETLLGRLTNLIGGNSVFANAPFAALKLVDVSKTEFPATTSFDGFDVAKVTVAPVPLPAAGLMLLGGLGGLAALRRRKKAA